MSIRVIAAGVITAGMVLATCGTAVAATSRPARPAVQLTGVQLLSALLPQSDFPAGFKLDKSNIFDSGRHFENSPAQYHLSTMSCSSFSNDFGGTGFGETATAADDFTNSTGTRVYGQQVYQFKTGSAATSFFKGLRAISRRCRAFLLDGFASGIFTQAFGARPIGGHPTFQVNQSGSFTGILIATDMVFTVAGTDVFFTANFGIEVSPPSSPSARTSMLRLIIRVRAFR
jgi:hypothetical protein